MTEEEEVEGAVQPPAEEILTCEGAKDAILQLIDQRKGLEEKLLERFDKNDFKEKKRIDRTIRHLFEDFAICNIGEEQPTALDKETSQS